MLFLGLEILSIATYVMAGFRREDVRSNESSMKYFILGSFSSAFLLFGIALVYGATAKVIGGGAAGPTILPGSTNIGVISERLNDCLSPPLLFAGAAMMMVGFGFKIASAPFHVWTPDVYEGAPTPVTAFMAAGPKAAGFAASSRCWSRARSATLRRCRNISRWARQLEARGLALTPVSAIVTRGSGQAAEIAGPGAAPMSRR